MEGKKEDKLGNTLTLQKEIPAPFGAEWETKLSISLLWVKVFFMKDSCGRLELCTVAGHHSVEVCVHCRELHL